MEKINISKIFRDHFNTLKCYDTGNISKQDIFVFIILPFVISIFICLKLDFDFLININSELIAFYSIFGGFMLNVLALMYNYSIDKFKNPKIAGSVLKEIRANLAYLISIASFSIILLLLIRIFDHMNIISTMNLTFNTSNTTILILKHTLTSLLIFLLINFSLTVFMVLKRFYSLESNID